MIGARSPYYLEIPWNRPSDNAKADSFTLNLFIWVGNNDGDIPNSPQYLQTIYNVEDSTGSVKVDIANLISDFIPTQVITSVETELLDGLNTVWVRRNVEYNVNGDITTELQVTDASTNGYGYGNEGENFQTTKQILSDAFELDAYKNGVVQVPIVRDFFGGVVKLKVNTLPSETTIFQEEVESSQESTEIVSVLNINCKEAEVTGDDCIEVEYGSDTYTIFLRDELKKTPIDVSFLNRYGHLQTMTFFKERRDSLEVSTETYLNRFAQPNTGSHQNTSFNKNGQTSFSIESGFVGESENEILTQMLLSEYVWIGTNPVDVTTTSVQYKTQNNDKLVNYNLEFKDSYTKINSI